jgi:hypothetical protein
MIEDKEEERPGPAVRVGKVFLVGRPRYLHKVCLLIRIFDDLLAAIYFFACYLG